MREIARAVFIAPGNAGIMQTLDRMRLLILRDLHSLDHAAFIAWGLRQAVAGAPPHPSIDVLTGAIYEWVVQHLSYTADGAASDSVLAMEEELRAPSYLLHRIYQFGIAEGDCDDFVILLVALLKACGITVRFAVTSARNDQEFDHVFVQVWNGAAWNTLDGIHGAPMGWQVPLENVTNAQTVSV